MTFLTRRHSPLRSSSALILAKKVAGAGSLPGTILESGVANPAPERSADDKSSPGYIKEILQGSLPSAVVDALGFSAASTVDGRQNETSLPSQDTTSTQPDEHVSGVGALPGSNSESGVAQLSLERNAGNSEISRTVEGGDDSTISKAKDAVSQIKPVAFNISPVGSSGQEISLPSQDLGQQPGEKTGGVGALPGGKEESGVAVLPDEKSAPADASAKHVDSRYNSNTTTGSQSTDIPGIPDAVDANIQSKELPERPHDSSVYPDVHGPSAKDDIPGVPPKAESVGKPPALPNHDNSAAEAPSGGARKSPGDEESYQASELHPVEAKYSHDDATEKKSTTSDLRLESAPSAGSPRKVGFMDKVTGGSKVLFGKLGHNSEKVEEGRKILHGEA